MRSGWIGVALALSIFSAACRSEKPAEDPTERARRKVDRPSMKTEEQVQKDTVDTPKPPPDEPKKNIEKNEKKPDKSN